MEENAIPIPESPPDITSEWLNKALSVSTPKATVRSAVVEPIEGEAGLSGQLALIRVDYSDNKGELPRTMVAKLSSTDAAIRSAYHDINSYGREVRFYQELADTSANISAECYYADIDLETGCSILLIEDLSEMRKVYISDGCGLIDSRLVISRLAQFHSQWWQDRRLSKKSYIFALSDMADFRQKKFCEWWEQFPVEMRRHFPDLHITKIFEVLSQKCCSEYARICGDLAQEPVTLIHKDTHIDNFLFSDDEARGLVLLDWQLYGYARSAIDLAYFIIMSTDINLRRESENEFLRLYFDSLVASGVSDYSLEQITADYVRSFYWCLNVFVAIVGPGLFKGSYGRAVVESMLPRLTAFGEDHEALLLS